MRGIDPELLKHREKRGPPDQISRAKHRGQVRIPRVSQPGNNLRFRTTLRCIKPSLDGLRQAEDTRLPECNDFRSEPIKNGSARLPQSHHDPVQGARGLSSQCEGVSPQRLDVHGGRVRQTGNQECIEEALKPTFVRELAGHLDLLFKRGVAATSEGQPKGRGQAPHHIPVLVALQPG